MGRRSALQPARKDAPPFTGVWKQFAQIPLRIRFAVPKRIQTQQAMGNSNPHSENIEADGRWCRDQRQIVVDYLRRQGVEHGAIGEWPAWHLSPYVSIWAIESIARPGWIGWWVIAGDLPTDYISSSDVDGPQDPRKVMKVFARNWIELVTAWKDSRNVENATIGELGQREILTPLLQSRARVLAEWADDDSNWRS